MATSIIRRFTALKSHKRLNPISPKRIQQINDEIPDRIALCQRCGGHPVIKVHTIKMHKEDYILKTVTCVGGVCELCHRPAGYGILEPHEKLLRSHGGQVSLQNSLMVHRLCHFAQHNENRAKRA